MWLTAKENYEKYFKDIYNKDLDAYLEYSEILTHFANFTKDEKERDEFFDKAIRHIEFSQVLEEGNFFHKIRIGEIHFRKGIWNKSAEMFEQVIQDYLQVKDDNDVIPKLKELANMGDKDIKLIKSQLINLGICYINSKNANGLEQTIEKIKIVDNKMSILDGLEHNLKRLRKDQDPKDFGINSKAVISKGSAMNDSKEEQLWGTLLLLDVLKNDKVTFNQIKHNWLNSRITTKRILLWLLTAKYIEKNDGSKSLGIKDAYFLTKRGKEKVKDIKNALCDLKVSEEEKNQTKPRYSKLLKKYEIWKIMRES